MINDDAQLQTALIDRLRELWGSRTALMEPNTVRVPAGGFHDDWAALIPRVIVRQSLLSAPTMPRSRSRLNGVVEISATVQVAVGVPESAAREHVSFLETLFPAAFDLDNLRLVPGESHTSPGEQVEVDDGRRIHTVFEIVWSMNFRAHN